MGSLNDRDEKTKTTTIRMEIPGIKCQKCVNRILFFLRENHPGLMKFDYPDSVQTDFDRKIVSFKILDQYGFTEQQLKKTIESIDSEKFACTILSVTIGTAPLLSSHESTKTESTSSSVVPLLGHQDSNDNKPNSKKSPILLSTSIQSSPNKHSKKGTSRKCFISIQGMTCSSCVDKIESKLKKTPGIIACQIGLITARAEIDFEHNHIDPETIVDLIDDMGYEVSLLSVFDSDQQNDLHLDIMGISNDDDVKQIHKTILEIIGVAQVNVDRDSGRAMIIYYPNVIGPRRIVDKISELGFTVHTINSFDPDKFTETMKRDVAKWRQSFLISLIFGLPTILVMIYFMYIMPALYKNDHQLEKHKCCVILGLSLENLLLFCLASPVQIFGARYFYIQAFKSLRNGHLSMDVLIMLATTIAYLYSVCIVLYFILTEQRQSPMTFFDTPPMLLLFISLGRWLEHLNRLRTTEYIVKLMSFRPTKAILLDIEQKFAETKEFVVKNERVIDIDLVEKGDYLRVRPGERIPTDGRMIVGEAMVDESFINGESMPVAKKSGSLLLGGSIVSNGIVVMVATNVGTDSQLCQIVKMVENAQTTKAPIQQLADRISSYFIPFVIATSILSFAVWLWIGPLLFDKIIALNPKFYEGMTRAEIVIQFAFQISLSVMIISCPCALGIATPSAVIIGTGIGAVNGIHIKGAEPLERAQNLDTVIFDKTGTLTYGKTSVTNLKLLHRFPSNEFNSNVKKLLILIGMAESNSDHPIANAVTKFIRQQLSMDADGSFGQVNTKFKLEAGLGIRSQVDRNLMESFYSSLDQEKSHNDKISFASFLKSDFKDGRYLIEEGFFEQTQFNIVIGNNRWMEKNNIHLDDEFQKETTRLEFYGETVFNVAINGRVLCLISVSDLVKPEAMLSVYLLRKRYGLNVMLLTGDNIRSAMAIANRVGISDIYAELLPQHKMDKIKHLQRIGKRVAMVGDGINDAPALAQADLGIAIAKGTDITMESADIVLTKDDLLDIVSCVDLSKKTMRRIRINFLLAFFYNFVFIPIAAGVFIHLGLILQPWMSGACMAFSSISVSFSSLLLRRYRIPHWRQFNDNDYVQYRNRIKMIDEQKNVDLDQLSLHNAHNLLSKGVKHYSELYRGKFNQNLISDPSSESVSSAEHSDNNDEIVQLIDMRPPQILLQQRNVDLVV